MGHRETLNGVVPLWQDAPDDGTLHAPPQPAQDLAAQADPNRPRRRRTAWIAALALAAAVAVGWQLTIGREVPAPLATAVAERTTIEDVVSATGALQPLEFVDVCTQVTGQLRTLNVAVGSTVQKGQLVAEIDPTVFESKVATARAQLRNLEAQLREREAQAQLAELVRDRNRTLRRADAVSEEILQQTDAAAVQARAQVDAVRAQIEQGRSSLAGEEANLRYTRIYAPMSGTVVALNVRVGQTLVSSQQAPVILRIADLGTMTVWAQVSEADVPRLAVGMPVYFNTLGLPDRRWSARVRQVLPTPETVNNVVLYNVLFDVANPDGVLRPQMSTQVFFRVASAEDAISIPPTALQASVKTAKAKPAGKDRKDKPRNEAHERSYTVRVLHDGKVQERTVTVGLQTRMQAQVTSGLEAGEEVVIDGAPKAKGKKSPGTGAS